MTKSSITSIISALFIAAFASGCGSDEFTSSETYAEGSGGFTETGGTTGAGSTNGSGSAVGSGGTASGGTGEDTGSGGYTGEVCIPKTCEEYSIEKTGVSNRACGQVPDGCGGYISCQSDTCNGVDFGCGDSVDIETLKQHIVGIDIESTFDTNGILYGDDSNICYGGSVRVPVATCGPTSVTWVTAARGENTVDEVTALIQAKQGSGQTCRPYGYGLDGYITCCDN